MLIKCEEEIFQYQEGFLDTQNIFLCNTNYVRKNNVFTTFVVSAVDFVI